VQSLGMEANVEYRHHLPRTRLFEEITHSSCIVIPSYSEGFCFVAAESVALGVPVISSHQGALPEVVGGHYISMQAQKTEILEHALDMAAAGKWTVRPPVKYLLADAVAHYISLYEGLQKSKESYL
jgi:glycosyltransferase involved in cell wall biosynthesis